MKSIPLASRANVTTKTTNQSCYTYNKSSNRPRGIDTGLEALIEASIQSDSEDVVCNTFTQESSFR